MGKNLSDLLPYSLKLRSPWTILRSCACQLRGMVGSGQGKSTLFLDVATVELTAAAVVVISS